MTPMLRSTKPKAGQWPRAAIPLLYGRYDRIEVDGTTILTREPPQGYRFHDIGDRSTRSIARQIGGHVWDAQKRLERQWRRDDRRLRTLWLTLLWLTGRRA